MSKLYYLNWKKPFRSIKYIIQRIKYGWCDADAIGSHIYLDEVLTGVLRQLKKDVDYYPMDYNNFADWITDIGECASKIERAYNLEEEIPLPPGPDEDQVKWYRTVQAIKEEAQEMRKEAFTWLAEHWSDL